MVSLGEDLLVNKVICRRGHLNKSVICLGEGLLANHIAVNKHGL